MAIFRTSGFLCCHLGRKKFLSIVDHSLQAYNRGFGEGSLIHAGRDMLTQEVKEEIQTAYRCFLEKKGLRSRDGQRRMIAQIARSLAAVTTDGENKRTNPAGLCAIEAGTGTGKTVAYILATIPMAKAMGKKVVISTATVALQEQILFRDIPDILRHSGLQFRFALAKGRGRYVCLARLDSKLDEDDRYEALFAMDQPQALLPDKVRLFKSMSKALMSAEWDGDRDNWPDEITDEDWLPLTTERNQCAGRRCQYFSSCSFYKSRENLQSVDCIIANHDLVMSDMVLGGGKILPPPEETVYLFDEGHHLAETALRHFSCQVRIHSGTHWLDQCTRVLQEVLRHYHQIPDLAGALHRLPPLVAELRQHYSATASYVEQLMANNLGSFSGKNPLPHFLFPLGCLPDPLQQVAGELGGLLDFFEREITVVHDLIANSMSADSAVASAGSLERLYASIGQILSVASRHRALWEAYAHRNEKQPDAHWIQVVDSGGQFDFELNTSPLLAADYLQKSLWDRCHAAILTSATLTALGSFDRISLFCGLPSYLETLVLASPFNYREKSVLVVPALRSDPKDASMHTQEIADLLPELTSGHLGVLVLFSSRRQMQDVFSMLAQDVQQKVLCQGSLSKQKLIEQHRASVDAGNPSMIFGLASFSEGVDLPGNYCTHVIIAKIPFSPPDNPVDSALSDWFKSQGRNSFQEINLPYASQRLIQACGRLIRNENDVGQITLLDKRIETQWYGRKLLEALPPFRLLLSGRGVSRKSSG